jgi:pimeloyl-ACP methyl ester carboxylesterase
LTTLFRSHHRGGSGPPLLLLHGFLDTWRTWELVLPRLERRHEVLAPTLPGHAGGPQAEGPLTLARVADAVERAMDESGFETAHMAGNSLGGHIALQLAARGRARSVVAFAPAGGWASGDRMLLETLRKQRELVREARRVAPFIAGHELLGVAASKGAEEMLDHAARADWTLRAELITCPVRVVWGLADELLPLPSAAVRFRTEWLPNAEWVELEGAGHAPQLDLPLETAQLILGVTS